MPTQKPKRQPKKIGDKLTQRCVVEDEDGNEVQHEVTLKVTKVARRKRRMKKSDIKPPQQPKSSGSKTT